MTVDQHRRRLQVWLGIIAATTLLVLMVGGITRLTHSGLSIVDWRPLIGVIPPLNEADWVDSFQRYQQFPEYRQLWPNMTLEDYKHIFFWEYLHRLLARLIGVIFIVPFAVFFFSGALSPSLMRRLLALFVLGSMQGVAGWLMVRSGLIDRPSVSHYRLAIHLTLAMIILGGCVWMIRDLSGGTTAAFASDAARHRARRLSLIVGSLLGLQIVWGAFVAGLKAGFVFNTFPLMAGTLVPMSYWVLQPTARNLVENQAGVQWTHRLLGTALLVAAAVLALRVRQMRMDRSSRRLSTALFWAIAAQYVTGVLTLVNGVPLGLALAHQVIAALIVSLWAWTQHHVRR